MCRCAVAVDGGHVVPLVVVDVVQVCVGGCVDLCLHGDGGDGGERLERHHQRGGDGDGGAGGPIRERLERLERHHRRAGNGDGGERLERHHRRAGDGDGGGDGQQGDLCFWLCAPRKLLLSQPHAHAPYLCPGNRGCQKMPARERYP